MSSDSPALTGRDRFGRFQPGCAPGPGSGVMRRRKSLAAAAAAALADGDVEAVLRSLLTQAQAGDVPAATLLLNYSIGRPRVQADSVDIDLPAIESVGSLADAMQRIVVAVGAGDLDLDAAERLASLVATVGEVTVLRDLEQRVAAVESTNGGFHGSA